MSRAGDGNGILISLFTCHFVDGQCPGVCVADRIAEYCEAYLITGGLCKSGSKCCVSRDIYPADKMPADLRIPNAQSSAQTTNNRTNPPSKPTKTSMQPSPTQGARPKPTKVITSSHSTRPQTPTRESVEMNGSNGGAHNGINRHPCAGDCVGSFVSLFCDELDAEAFCPNEGTCCKTNEDGEHKGTTQRPQPVSVRSLNVASSITNLRQFNFNQFIYMFLTATTTEMSRFLFAKCVASILRSAVDRCSIVRLQRGKHLLSQSEIECTANATQTTTNIATYSTADPCTDPPATTISADHNASPRLS